MTRHIAVFGTQHTTQPAVRQACEEYTQSLKGQDVVIHVQDILDDRRGVNYWIIQGAFFADLTLHTYGYTPMPVFGLPYTKRVGHVQWQEHDDFAQVIMAQPEICCVWNGLDILTRSRLELARGLSGKVLRTWQGGVWIDG